MLCTTISCAAATRFVQKVCTGKTVAKCAPVALNQQTVIMSVVTVLAVKALRSLTAGRNVMARRLVPTVVNNAGVRMMPFVIMPLEHASAWVFTPVTAVKLL